MDLQAQLTALMNTLETERKVNSDNAEKNSNENKILLNKISELETALLEVKENSNKSKSNKSKEGFDLLEINKAAIKALKNTISTGNTFEQSLKNVLDWTTWKGWEFVIPYIDSIIYKEFTEDALLSKVNLISISWTNEYKKLKMKDAISAYYEDDTVWGADTETGVSTGLASFTAKTVYARSDVYLPAINNVANVNFVEEIARWFVRSMKNFASNKILNGLQVEAIRWVLNSPTKKVVTSTATAIKDITKKDVLKFINAIDDIYLENGQDLVVVWSKYVYSELAGERDPNQEVFKEFYDNRALITTISGVDFVKSRYAPSQTEASSLVSKIAMVAFVGSQYLLINQTNATSYEEGYINDKLLFQTKTLLYRTAMAGWLVNEDACAVLMIS